MTTIRLHLSSDLSTYGQYSGEESPAAWKETADAAIVEYLESKGYDVDRRPDEYAQRAAILGDDGLPVETMKAQDQAESLLRSAWEHACGI